MTDKENTVTKNDAGQAEVQAKVDKETDQGFRGTKVDPLPNEAYSIKTGPDSPTLADSNTRADQHCLQEG